MSMKILFLLTIITSFVTAQRAGNEEGEIDDLFKNSNEATSSDDEPKVTIN
jgi:hypothetical protein